MKDARTSSVRGSKSHKSGGELVQIRFTNQDSSGLFQPFNGGRILLGNIRKCRTTGRRRKVRRVDIVLDCEWDSKQWMGRCAMQSLGGAHSVLFRNKMDPDRIIRKCPDPPVNFTNHIAGRQTTRSVVCLQRPY